MSVDETAAQPATAPAQPATAGDQPETAVQTPTGYPGDIYRPRSRYESIRHQFVTPQAIYGTLLVSAIIGTAVDEDSDLEVLITVIGTVIAFWIAHVFAEGIFHYGKHAEGGLPFLTSLKHSLHDAAGLLYAAFIPCAFLLLGALGLMKESLAYSISLLLPVALLGALGWFALADRGSPWWGRLLGALVTGLLGVFVIILKITFH